MRYIIVKIDVLYEETCHFILFLYYQYIYIYIYIKPNINIKYFLIL